MADFHSELLAGSKVALITLGGTLAADAESTGDLDNTTNGWLEGYLVYVGGWDSVAPTAGARAIDLYLMPGYDDSGATFPDESSAGLPAGGTLIWSFVSQLAQTASQVMAGPPTPVRIPAEHSRWVISNVSGQTLATGGILYLIPQKALMDEQ